MSKILKKIISLFMCFLMILSCLNGYVFIGIGNIVAKALDNTPIAGDINGDGTVNNKDLTRLMKHIAGEDVEVVAVTIDPNGDGTVNNKDLTRLMKYLAGEDVTIVITGCTHEKDAIDAVEATCANQGNIAYWYCEACNKYFSDEEGTSEITFDDTVVAVLPHTEEIIPGYPATTTETGLSDGIKCSVCDKILEEQIVIPISEYEIVYKITDKYLQTLDRNGELVNNNPKSYSSEKGVLSFDDIIAKDGEDVPGYTFLGWYDAPQDSPDAVRVKKIAEGEVGKITLYAHWSKVSQKVYFKSDLTQPAATTMEYYIDEGSAQFEVLKAPDTYIFVGWSDENGVIHDRVPAGTEGPVTYTANWISNRNQAWAKKDVGEPIIYEDENVILYAYEIGEIRNVPMYTIVDFGYINASGIDTTVEYEHSSSVSVTHMQQYTSAVSKSTTESFGWTLSNGWSESVSLNEEWAKEEYESVEVAESVCKNDSNEWYISSGKSGSDTTVTLDTSDNYDLTTTTSNTKTYDTNENSVRDDSSAEINANISAGYEIKVPGGKGHLDASMGASLKEEHGETTNSKTGTESDAGSNDQDGSIKHAGTEKTETGSWNSESGYRSSSSVTTTNAITSALSTLISQKTGYGQEYINSNNEDISQGTVSADESSEEYSSSVSYAHTVTDTVKTTYTTNETVTGYHRWVMAGTAHVFAVVGYDIKTQSYFVRNYTIMDDEMYKYEDYSYKTATYDDHQNGLIPFSVPTDIVSHVIERTFESDDLQISKTGVVTGYTGTDTFVVIPEYHVSVNPKDNSTTVTKIVGIDANAFADKKDNITAVVLSDFITEIPDNCFKDFKSLISIDGIGITSIGENAFSGCDNLKSCTLNDNVISIKENAFVGFDYLEVIAANKSVAEMALKSGAKEVVVTVADKCTDLSDVELIVPNTVEKFTFNGNGKELNNVSIVSDAAETIINRADFVSTGKTPLVISSPDITLLEVTVISPSIAFISSAPEAEIALYGESYIGNSDKDAMLCKNVTLSIVDSKWFSKLHVSGNVLLCGEIENKATLLSVTNGEIISIDETEFENYKKGTVTVLFDTNDGYFDESVTEKTVYYGQTYGNLPVPKRGYYTFAGWFTAKDGGTEITATSNVSAFGEQTLYAHWTENPVSDWVLASSMPSGAQVVSQEWRYTLREYTENSASSLSGWTKYDTKRTSWGATQGPVYTDPSNGSRNVWSEKYVASTTTHYTFYHRYGWGTNVSTGQGAYVWGSDAQLGSGARHEIDLTYDLTQGTNFAGNARWKGYKCPQCGESNIWLGRNTYTENHYSTRWYYQEPVYTYYYYKDLSKVATSDPTGTENVSNVQKWVQYRAK